RSHSAPGAPLARLPVAAGCSLRSACAACPLPWALLALPLWLPLADEGVHPLFLVAGGKQEVEIAPLEGQPLCKRQFKRLVDRLLRQPHGDRRAGGDLVGQP